MWHLMLLLGKEWNRDRLRYRRQNHCQRPQMEPMYADGAATDMWYLMLLRRKDWNQDRLRYHKQERRRRRRTERMCADGAATDITEGNAKNGNEAKHAGASCYRNGNGRNT